MHYAKSILGMTAVNLAVGERIGRIQDLIIDPEQRQVLALLIKPVGLLTSSRAVLYEGVRSVGKDAVVVTNESFIVPVDRHPGLKAAKNRGITILGKPVMTEGGRMLGIIRDVVIDSASGRVHGYVMTNLSAKGFPRHFSPVLPADETIVVGRHLAMVSHLAEYFLAQAADEAETAEREAKRRRSLLGAIPFWGRSSDAGAPREAPQLAPEAAASGSSAGSEPEISTPAEDESKGPRPDHQLAA